MFFAFLRVGLVVMLFTRLMSMISLWWVRRGTPVLHGGQTWYVAHTRNRNRSYRDVRLTCDLDAAHRFVLRRENWFDDEAKNLGLAREWQTGDASFDKAVFIAAEDPALLDALTADAGLRRQVADMLRVTGLSAICAARHRLWINCGSAGLTADFDGDVPGWVVSRYADSLGALRKTLEGIQVDEEAVRRQAPFRRQLWITMFIVLCALAGCAALLPVMMQDESQVVFGSIMRLTVLTTGAVVAALLAAIFAFLRGTSLAHRVFLDVILAALPGAWLASQATYTWYNQQYDDSNLQMQTVYVEDAWTRKGRHSRTYYIRVKEWPDPRGGQEIQVRKSTFDFATPGTCIEAAWHVGRLGDGWVSGYQRAQSKSC